MVPFALPGPCHPLGTPVKTRVISPWGRPGQPPWLDGWGHALFPLLSLMVTVVWFRTRSTVTVVVIFPCVSVYTAWLFVAPPTLMARLSRSPCTYMPPSIGLPGSDTQSPSESETGT